MIVSLLGLMAFSTAILLIEEKWWFYVLGCGIGTLIGPAQAAGS